MRKYLYILIGFLAILLASCDNSTSTNTQSSVAKLTSFGLANDSFPGLKKAVFTIEERIDTGLVYNKDSMLYGTKLNKVRPYFSFAATPSASALIFPDTVVSFTGNDTVDFTKSPIYFAIRSADKKNIKVYEIRATVHQADPDLYTWEKLNEGIYPSDDSEQKVVDWKDHFYMFTSNGFELNVYRSPNGIAWTDLGEPEGLPIGTRVRQIICDNNTFYYGVGNTVYTSADAVHWTAHSVSGKVVTMLLYWEDLVWVLTEPDEYLYELAWYRGDSLHMTGIVPDGEFPVSDFGAVAFNSASGRDRAMIIGGFAKNGRSLNTRWNLEYTKFMEGGKGSFRLEEFSIGRPFATSATGISVVWYDDKLLLFGGVDDKMSYLGQYIYFSNNEGMSWTLADTTKNKLPDTYQARQKQNAIRRGSYVYLFGGQDSKVTHSDVYRGKLNSIDWK